MALAIVFNIAHSAGLVVCALACEREVGVDVEDLIRPPIDQKMVRRYCAPDERPDRPAAWTLGRLGGPSFTLTSSLSDEEVGDGEILELRAPSAAVSAAHMEDVRDAVEEAVDESGRQWRPATTVRFAVVRSTSRVKNSSSAVLGSAFARATTSCWFS